MENLSLGDDNAELISELLGKHKNLTFLFEDAHGVITITQQAAPGILTVLIYGHLNMTFILLHCEFTQILGLKLLKYF